MAEEPSPESKLYVKEEIERSSKEIKEQVEKVNSKATKTFTTVALVVGLLTGLSVYGSAKHYISTAIQEKLGAEALAEFERHRIQAEKAVIVAEGLVADANKVAEGLVADTNKVAERLVADANKVVEGLVADANSLVKGITELKSNAEDLVKDINSHEAQAKQSASDIGDIKSEAGQILSSIVIVGTIVPYGGTIKDNPPGQPHQVGKGWLFCNGAALNRNEYEDLYKVLGVAFGAPDDDSFNLPDLRGRFVRGVDHGAGRDPDANNRQVSNKRGHNADNVGSLQPDALMRHSHPLEKPIYEHYRSFAGWKGTDLPLKSSRGYEGDQEWKVKTEETGGQETRPKNVYVNWIIKAQ